MQSTQNYSRSVEAFLATKPLFYTKFDPTRMHKAYESIKVFIPKIKTVHIVGTNGKGTTGTFLAQMLMQQGLKVGHYTSPHIFKVHERIAINNSPISDKALFEAFSYLNSVLDTAYQEALSYFEYTTFLAMMAFRGCDYIVLEAGLGGEHDATAVFSNILTIITPIGKDHEAFLGNSIEEIAATKTRAVKQKALIATQSNEAMNSILSVLKAKKLSYEKTKIDINKAIQLCTLPEYLKQNMQLAYDALHILGYLEVNFATISPQFGRFSQVLPNVIVDVGHNALAARRVAQALKNKVVLIYNTLEDKAYEEILSILKPHVVRVEILPIKDERALLLSRLKQTLKKLNIPYSMHKKLLLEPNYLVFGSFKVVETFMNSLKDKED